MELLTENNFEKLREELRSKKRPSANNRAWLMHQRLKLHTDVALDYEFCEDHFAGRERFLSWVARMLDPVKYDVFRGYFRPPYPTNAVTNWVKSEWSRAFKATNRNITDIFKQESTKADAMLYLDKVGVNKFVQVDSFNRYWSTPNDYIFFEYEEDKSTNYPFFEPCIIPVMACKFYECGEYFGYTKQDDSKTILHACDVQNFYKCEVSGNEIIGEVEVYLHNLGFLPAMQLSDIPLNSTDKDVVTNNFVPYLTDLDLFIYDKISKVHVDNYASHPVMAAFKKQCDYKSEFGTVCADGFIYVPEYAPNNTTTGVDNLPSDFDAHTSPSYRQERCPQCSKSGLVGAGSLIQKPVPMDKDAPDLSQPLEFLSPKREILDYTLEKLSAMELKLKEQLAGYAEIRDIAKNETQVKNSTESRKTILLQIAEAFQRIEKFVRCTLLKLRYQERYVDSVVNYGSDWLLKDSASVTEEYNQAQLAGLPHSELTLRYALLAQTEYGTDKRQLTKADILSKIEPYSTTPMAQVIELAKIGVATSKEVHLKGNIGRYVAMLEANLGTNIVDAYEIVYAGNMERLKAEIEALIPDQAPMPTNLNSNTQPNS